MSRDWAEIVYKEDIILYMEEVRDELRFKGVEKMPQINAMCYGMDILIRKLHFFLEEHELTVKKSSLEIWDKTSGTDRPW